MIRKLLLVLALIALIIQIFSKTDAFGYNRAPRISFISESHTENTHHPYQKTVTKIPIRAAPYQTEHVPRAYNKMYGGHLRYSSNKPRIQYTRQHITPRKSKPSMPSISQLYSFQPSRSYVPQIFVHKHSNTDKLLHSKNVRYRPNLSKKPSSPQLQNPHGIILEETIPYQATFSSIRNQPVSLNKVRSKPEPNYSDKRFSKASIKPSSFNTEHITSNRPMYQSIPKASQNPSSISYVPRINLVTKYATHKSTSNSPTSLGSKSTVKYMQMALDDNAAKHTSPLAYGEQSKKMSSVTDTVGNDQLKDEKHKSSNAKGRQYLSSIPDDIDSKYNPKWPYGSKDKLSDQVNDEDENADNMNILITTDGYPNKEKHYKIEAPTERIVEQPVMEKNYEMEMDSQMLESQGDDRICCRAMTAECLACTAGISISEYCGIHPATIGCEGRYQGANPNHVKKIRMVRKKYRPEVDHSSNMDWNCEMYGKNENYDAEILTPYGC